MADKKDNRKILDTECQLFVAKLGEMSEASLKEYFLQFGEVTQCHIKRDDWNAGKSRGFGFVTFATKEPVVAALAQPEHYINDTLISVSPAEDRRHGTNGAHFKAEAPEVERLFVGNLPEGCEATDLIGYFQQFGEIDPERVMVQEGKQFGFIQFKDAEVAKQALEYDGHVIGGNKVTVQKSEGRKNKAAMMAKSKGKGGRGNQGGNWGNDNWGNGGNDNWGNGGNNNPMMGMMNMMMQMMGNMQGGNMGGNMGGGMGGNKFGGSKGKGKGRFNPY